MDSPPVPLPAVKSPPSGNAFRAEIGFENKNDNWFWEWTRSTPHPMLQNNTSAYMHQLMTKWLVSHDSSLWILDAKFWKDLNRIWMASGIPSPTWHMKSGITRWKADPLKWRGLPDLPTPFSPVHKQRKFSAVFGATSVRSSMVMRPAGLPPMVMSSVFWIQLTANPFSGQNENHENTQKTVRLKQSRPLG